jgi:hypothetical protein
MNEIITAIGIVGLALILSVSIFASFFVIDNLWQTFDKLSRRRSIGDYRTRKQIIKEDGWF